MRLDHPAHMFQANRANMLVLLTQAAFGSKIFTPKGSFCLRK